MLLSLKFKKELSESSLFQTPPQLKFSKSHPNLSMYEFSLQNTITLQNSPDKVNEFSSRKAYSPLLIIKFLFKQKYAY